MPRRQERENARAQFNTIEALSFSHGNAEIEPERRGAVIATFCDGFRCRIDQHGEPKELSRVPPAVCGWLSATIAEMSE